MRKECLVFLSDYIHADQWHLFKEEIKDGAIEEFCRTAYQENLIKYVIFVSSNRSEEYLLNLKEHLLKASEALPQVEFYYVHPVPFKKLESLYIYFPTPDVSE